MAAALRRGVAMSGTGFHLPELGSYLEMCTCRKGKEMEKDRKGGNEGAIEGEREQNDGGGGRGE